MRFFRAITLILHYFGICFSISIKTDFGLLSGGIIYIHIG